MLQASNNSLALPCICLFLHPTPRHSAREDSRKIQNSSRRVGPSLLLYTLSHSDYFHRV
jgi:hypothetical protein